MALEFQPLLLASWAVGEGNVVVSNVVEEVKLILVEHQASGDGVDRSITPALVEEATVSVKSIKVGEISIGTKPVQVSDLKV